MKKDFEIFRIIAHSNEISSQEQRKLVACTVWHHHVYYLQLTLANNIVKVKCPNVIIFPASA